jgi:MtrB/PioB family decaheme-associated outer membrane protein
MTTRRRQRLDTAGTTTSSTRARVQPPRRAGSATLALLIAAACPPHGAHAQGQAQGQSQDGGDGRIVEREVHAGIGYLDDGDYRYGKYSGLVSRGLEPLLGFGFSSRPEWDSGGTVYWEASGTRLGQDARQLSVVVGRYGTQRLEIGWQQVPRYFLTDTTRTPFRDVGSAFLSLPPGWTATGNTTADLPLLAPNLEDVGIRERRRRFDIDYERELGRIWTLDVSFRRDEKAGTRIRGATIGSTGGNARAALLPAPLAYETNIIDAGLTRSGTRHMLGFAYTGSFFRNGYSSLTWQNPFGAQPQWAEGVGFPDGLGRLALEPENSFHQVSASAAYSLGTATRLSASFARGRMLQDEAFLAFTVNPRLDLSQPLPRASLDGQVDVTRLSLELTTRPTPNVNFTARYRHDDRDDGTPRAVYRMVRGDSENQLGAELGRVNRPYSLTKDDIELAASYRASRRLRVHAGYQFSDVDRDYSEIDNSEEHTYKAGLRFTAPQALSMTLDFVRARRSVDEYVGNRPLIETRVPGTVAEDDFENHPLLRKYYLADRDRDGFTLRGDVPIGGSASLGLSAAHNRDDYRNSVLGLNRATMRSYTLDGAFFPAEIVQLTAFYTRDRYTGDQSGRSFTAAPGQAFDPARDWRVDTRDRFDTAGVSLGVDRLEQHWSWLERRTGGRAVDAGLDVTYSASRGVIDVSSGAALETAPLPDLTTRLNHYRLYASYPLQNDASLRLAIEHERYRTRDFALDGVEPGTMANVIGLGHESPSYSVNWVVLTYSTRF